MFKKALLLAALAAGALGVTGAAQARGIVGWTLFKPSQVIKTPFVMPSLSEIIVLVAPTTITSTGGSCSTGGQVIGTQTSTGSSASVYASSYTSPSGSCTTTLITNP